MSFVVEQLDSHTWKVVEDDPFMEYPFIYIRKGTATMAVIDSGTGTSNIAKFIEEKLNPEGLPIILICTHLHFDHVGGCADLAEMGAEIAMGNRNKAYTENYAILSRAPQVGTQLKPFKVTKWLGDGDVVDLNAAGDDVVRANEGKKKGNTTREDGCLEVMHMPGHTEDSICVLDSQFKRIFVGDLIYPYTGVTVESPSDFRESLEKLAMLSADFATAGESDIIGDALGSGVGGGSQAHLYEHHDRISSADFEKIDEVADVLGLSVDELAFRVNPEKLLELADGVVDQAAMLYLNDPAAATEMCPPELQSQSLSYPMVSPGLSLACGHIEPALPIDSVKNALTVLEGVMNGALTPVSVKDGVGEFTYQQFTFLLPLTKL